MVIASLHSKSHPHTLVFLSIPNTDSHAQKKLISHSIRTPIPILVIPPDRLSATVTYLAPPASTYSTDKNSIQPQHMICGLWLNSAPHA